MRIIFHIDANSAYLSWTAAALLEGGCPVDLRQIPAVIAGDPQKRQGIILAKSIPAKAFHIKTGESLREAQKKYPSLLAAPPDYDLYLACSDAMCRILRQYSPLVQRYSVDECFLDFTGGEKRYGAPSDAANEIRRRIKRELGFTVNVGVGPNKLLAKMASELQKPDRVHTLLTPAEIREKMWPLAVEELFMVGRATAQKLHSVNIHTIGELARAEKTHMKALFKSRGEMLWEYANGIDGDPVVPNDEIVQKGLGNSTTTPYDITTEQEASLVLLALCERTAMRLRLLKRKASLVRVAFKTSEFFPAARQRQLAVFIDAASDIFRCAFALLRELWHGEPLRQLGVGVANFAAASQPRQLSLFASPEGEAERNSELERALDDVRRRFGERAVIRGCFANSPVAPLQGGVNDGNYIVMGGYRHEDLSRAD